MIDSNGTRHWAVLGADWLAGNPEGLDWNNTLQEVTLKRDLFLFASSAGDLAPSLSDRRGSAADQFGNWYWINAAKDSIRVRSAGNGVESAFWPASPTPPDQPSTFQPLADPPASRTATFSGLAITADHFLVAGTLNPPGLLRFDLYSGGEPVRILWPPAIAFTPFDIAAAPQGGVCVLDRDHNCFWSVGRHFQVLSQGAGNTVLAGGGALDFQPAAPEEPHRTADPVLLPKPVDLAATASITATHAVAIQALPDGTVLILETDPAAAFSRIHRFCAGKLHGAPVSTASFAKFGVSALRGFDMQFAASSSRLFLAGDQGNQSFAFALADDHGQLTADPVGEYFPMRRFDGSGLAGFGGDAYYGSGGRFYPLVSQKRARFETAASLETRVFDGHQPDCVWHRLLLDASIPPSTSVVAATRCSNSRQLLDSLPYQNEPDLVRRASGSEVPFVPSSGTGGRDTWETLFQTAAGRYLQIRLTLAGDGQASPCLRALRAYYPRFSYLTHYLPGAYREDRNSASFLDRFLANLEGLYSSIEDQVAAVQILFDWRSAPKEALDWLAGWFGVALDPAWDDARRRLFLKHAMDFFAARGTVPGIQWALLLALDPDPASNPFQTPGSTLVRIQEQFSNRRTPGLLLGDSGGNSGLRQVVQTTRWTPALGGEELSRRYRQALSLPAAAAYPVQPPDASTLGAWSDFSLATLGFVPSATAASLPRWQDFLERRYGTASRFQAAYAAAGASPAASFAAIPLPAVLPKDGTPLLDWFQFEGIVLQVARSAHRFTVLLKAPDNDFSGDKHRALQLLATRIVNLQKPAHTTFDVKFFWQMFQLGAARLGSDTLLDQPRGLPAMRLGQGYAGESYLSPNFPQDASSRQVLGRDRISSQNTSWQEGTS